MRWASSWAESTDAHAHGQITLQSSSSRPPVLASSWYASDSGILLASVPGICSKIEGGRASCAALLAGRGVLG